MQQTEVILIYRLLLTVSHWVQLQGSAPFREIGSSAWAVWWGEPWLYLDSISQLHGKLWAASSPNKWCSVSLKPVWAAGNWTGKASSLGHYLIHKALESYGFTCVCLTHRRIDLCDSFQLSPANATEALTKKPVSGFGIVSLHWWFVVGELK